MKMLIILYDKDGKDEDYFNSKARACILGRDMKWLLENAGIRDRRGSLELNGLVSQGGETLVDEFGMISDSDASDVWIRDYCAADKINVEFSLDNVIELRLGQDGVWYQAMDDWRWSNRSNKRGSVDPEFVFSSSYGGDGIKLPMCLDERGRRIMSGKFE